MADTPIKDAKTGRFLPGNSGNGGRPKGSRNKLAEAFISDIQADWEAHGVSTISSVREERPDIYLKVVASILPRDLNVNINPLEEAGDAELIARLRDLESVLRPFINVEGGRSDSNGAAPTTAH